MNNKLDNSQILDVFVQIQHNDGGNLRLNNNKIE